MEYRLRQDNIAIVVIKTWQMQNEAFDGIGGLAGPVPILFTHQPAELRTRVEQDRIASTPSSTSSCPGRHQKDQCSTHTSFSFFLTTGERKSKKNMKLKKISQKL